MQCCGNPSGGFAESSIIIAPPSTSPTEALPECAKHIAAVARALAKTSHLTLNNPTVVHTTHGVKEAIESDSFVVCNATRKQQMAEALTSPNVSYSTTGVMTTTMPAAEDGHRHQCIPIIQCTLKYAPTSQWTTRGDR